MSKVICWGATGQLKVMRPVIEILGAQLIASFDDTPHLSSPFDDVPLYKGKRGFKKWKKNIKDIGNYFFIVTIGNPHAVARQRIASFLAKQGLKPFSAIDPSACIRTTFPIGDGAQIHPAAIIQPFAQVGNHCIINTGALVEHDDILGDGVEVGPHATICGEVSVGKNTWIGAGATIKDKLSIGQNCIIGAGAVVVKDIPDNQIVVGNPAKFLKINPLA